MRTISLARGPRKTLVAVIAAIALVATGAALATAAGGGGANHSRGSDTGKAASARIVGQATNGGCKMSYDTESSTLIPPDDSTADNAAAGSVTIRKTCAGAVVGMFTSEVSVPNAGDFIHIDMRATCTATGGLATPCTVGQQIFASPGHSFFNTGADAFHSASIQMVWTGLRRGIWRFDVLPGGNNAANLQFRSFVVDAYAGG